MKKIREEKGITLIALVITIIVMLILVAVTISMAVNGGLFEYASMAVKETNKAMQREQELTNLILGMDEDGLIETYSSDLNPTGVELTNGDEYETDDYIYKLNHSNFDTGNEYSWFDAPTMDGWGVRVKRKGQKSYEPILHSINGKLVKNVDYLFYDDELLEVSPRIPEGVVSMDSTYHQCLSLESVPNIPKHVTCLVETFYLCVRLKNVPEIPETVTLMDFAFKDCSSIRGTLTINANPTSYNDCLKGAAINSGNQEVLLTGKSTLLNEILETAGSDANRFRIETQ